MVADTNDPTIGTSVEADIGHVKTAFGVLVARWQVHITTLSGNQVTGRQILGTIRSMNIQPGRDTVVFYYSGHGGFENSTGEHFIYPARRAVYRKDIRAALQQLQARLTVLISDTCSSYVERPPRAMAPAPGNVTMPVMRALFLEPAGLVDLSCTKPGEEARGDSNGGYFTAALTGCLLMHSEDQITWAKLIEDVNSQVPQQFSDAQQTAYSLSLPSGTGGGGNGGQPYRFGVVAVPTARSQNVGGIEVTQVIPGSPGTRMRSANGGSYAMVPGDVITQINDQPVTTYEGYHAVVKSSPSPMRVRVYHLTSETSEDYEVDLGGSSNNQAGPAGGVRLGVSVQRTARSAEVGGVEVAMVMEGFPGMSVRNLANGATRALVVGRDVITHINSEPITTYEEFRAAVAKSPSRMVLRVSDMEAHSSSEYEVIIARSGGGRFGVSTWPTQRSLAVGGVEVTLVLPDLPGTRLRSRSGQTYSLVANRDVITHVNGQPVKSYPEFVQAVSQSPREMTVRVYDLQAGTTEDYDVTLRE
jgi:S1-C subfamily serine protease